MLDPRGNDRTMQSQDPSTINKPQRAWVPDRFGVRWLACAVAASLVACGTVAPRPRPESTLVLPAQWSATSGAPSGGTLPSPLPEWWRRFDDPQLVALIDEALRANPSIRSSQAALAQSRALADVQSAALLPRLDATASAQRSRNGNSGSSNAFKVVFDASWEPDVFGGRHAGVSAAEAEVRANEASLGDVQVSVAAEVAVNYMQLRGLQARLAIAAANLRGQEETLQLTQWRAQAGLLTALEVDQARAATEQTRSQIPALQTAAVQAETSLAALVRRAPGTLHDALAAASAPAAGLLTPPDNLVLAIPAETLRQRPDLRSAEARVSAAAARVSVADAARLPSFRLGGSLGLNGATLGSLTHGASLAAAVLASVSASIFDGGAARAQLRAQEAALQQAAAGYDAALLAALKDVEDSLAALGNDRTRLQSLRVAADAAQSAAQLAAQRYASGLIDFQVVLDTQRTLLGTQDAVASAVATLNADHVRLYKALGGGWEIGDLQRVAADRGREPGKTSP